jgi:hypothetical protein
MGASPWLQKISGNLGKESAMSGGGGKSEKVVQSNKPWDAQVPLWEKSFDRLNSLYGSGQLKINPFPGETLAGVSPETRQAWKMAAARARQGSRLNRSAERYIGDVLAGDYLNRGAPGMTSVLHRAQDAVNANYALGGRYGSGAHDGAVAEATGSILYDNYARERAIQDQAARFAPELSREQYYDAEMLAEVGRQRQQSRQAEIDQRINRYNANQMSPINELALYQQLIGGNLGGVTTTTKPGGGQSPWLQGLGLLGNFLSFL